ncbi:MAG: purine-nucleoside phosphorylase [Deltaproteobacteria bacterium]|nr:MAG: purine-nucleoside phosphorylase [Deltaproteobacteria bacterium]
MINIEIDKDSLIAKVGQGPFAFALVLGSGFGELTADMEVIATHDYASLPGCPPVAAIPGHQGRLLHVRQGTREGLVFSGRFHLYQGLSAFEAAWPVRLAAALGAGPLLVTSAVGGINRSFAVGDPVFVEDHINLTADNPLRGQDPPPFVDLTRLYPVDLYPEMAARAEKEGVVLRRGVLACMPGPSYETPAEIRMLERLGADVVSMSMVPEMLVACACGLPAMGLALVTNKAAGRTAHGLDHGEVLEAGSTHVRLLRPLLEDFLTLLDRQV